MNRLITASLLVALVAILLATRTTPVMTKPPSVCVIGAGPGGMFFLHALASRRRKLEEELAANKKQDGHAHNAAVAAARAECEAKLAVLPVVDCYEKSSSPGGVWRSASASSGSPSTPMYEALWTNGNKEMHEFFDYTFDKHFQRPMPVYLPSAHVLDYMIRRVTQKANIFDDVLFNTTVISVEYNSERKEFDVVSRNEITGELTSRAYDKCIWSGGRNAEARMPRDLVAMLSYQNFQGRVMHSTEMNHFEANLRGKKVLLIGDSYSAEDLALQSIKLGAEQIYITSGESYGTASSVNAWPGDRVKVLWYMLPTGVTADGKGIILSTVKWNYSTERYDPKKGGEIVELGDISTVVMCTGYSPNMEYLSDELYNMYMERGLYRRALPLLELDVASWLCLAYVCGDVKLPTADEMEKQNRLEEDSGDDEFNRGSKEEEENIRYAIQTLARDMQAAGYPAGFGSYEKLSERGERLARSTHNIHEVLSNNLRLIYMCMRF